MGVVPITLRHNCLVIPRDAEDGQEQLETCSPCTCATFEHDTKLETFSKGMSIILITPQRLQEVYAQVNGCDDGSVEVNIESCNWLNVIVDFLFRELRDSPEVKRLVQYIL